MNNPNQSSAGPQGEQPSPLFRWTALLWLLLAILAFVWLLPSLLGQDGSPSNETVI